MLLEGKTAIVTGTGPNIGGEIARTLAANGARVVCLDVKEDQAKITANQIEKSGGSAIAVRADVTNPTDVENAVQAAVRQFGGVNLLVNNAAISPLGNLFDHDLDSWHRTLHICLTGTLLCSRYAAKQMISQDGGGAIVNISSTSGHRGRIDAIAYATSKGGLLQLTRVMANELAPHKIRVNSVSPTTSGIALATGRPHAEIGPPQFIPLGRWGKTEDQAEAVLFLLSPKADFITGIDLPVDGGLLSSGMFRRVPREK
jgi:NAD(P)-dependent dehydrogenase (short-subunit alcohol dehydrogenase family)